MCGPNYVGEVGEQGLPGELEATGPVGVIGHIGPAGPDYPPTPIVGDRPLSGPPGPDYEWVDDTENYTYGKWVKRRESRAI